MSKIDNCSGSFPFSLITLLVIGFGDCLVKMSARRGKAAGLISTLGQSLDRG